MGEIILKEPIFICAGEPSGDLYAGLFIDRLKKKTPDLKIYGVGGNEMRKSGVAIVVDYSNLMAFGFASGIYSVLENYKVYHQIAQKLYRIRPKTFIAVAYPGMNLLLCRYAKRLGCNIYYFLPPQIWAWGEFRKYFIKRYVDAVISVFPFEYEFYKRKGIKIIYFENPLFGKLRRYKRNDFHKKIGFMPGSRLGEIKRNLPVMFELIRRISQKRSNIEFFLILNSNSLALAREVIATKQSHKKYRKTMRLSRLKNEDSRFTEPRTSTGSVLAMTKEGCLDDPLPFFKVITENRYQAMKNCDLLITSSGTASLEAAIMEIPQIFFNRPSFFDYYFFKRFLKIKEFNLANIYFNKKIVSSFVSYKTHDILKNVYRLIISMIADF